MSIIEKIKKYINSRTIVVVMTRNYSTGLSVVRALGKEGYTVDVIASAVRVGKADLVKNSRFVRNFVEVVSPNKVKGDNCDVLINELLKYKENKKNRLVLLPTDDFSTSIMDVHREELKDIFYMPGVVGDKKITLKHLMDKSVQSDIASSVGMLTPKEWVISLREEIVIPEDMVYPCWCKPIESSQGYKREMKKCDSEEELKQHLSVLQNSFAKRYFLVQEFMDIDAEIDIEGCCIDQNIIIPGFITKDVIGEWDRGVPLSGSIVEKSENIEEGYDKIIKFLKELHYIGMFNLGIHIINGQIYFNEINLRSGGLNAVYFKSGSNLSDLFVRGVKGQRIRRKNYKLKQTNKTYIYEKVAWEDYLHGLMAKEKLNQLISDADITIMYDTEDEIPATIFQEEVEKREKIIKKREENIAKIIQATGWNRETVKGKLKEAREQVGVGLNDYTRNEFWKYSKEKQIEKYGAILERREKIRKKRERCVEATMKATGWDKEFAIEQINDARKRLGVTYDEYRIYKFYLLTSEEQKQKYYEIKKGKENS